VVLDLELVDATRAAGGLEVADLIGLLGRRDVPQHQPPLRIGVVARPAAPLDPCDRDITPIPGGVDDHVLSRGSGRVLERRDALDRSGPDFHDGNTVVRILGTEAVVRPAGPVLEAPLADVGVALVRPDIGVEAAVAERLVGDDLEIRRDLHRLLAALVRLVRLLEEVLLVLEQLVVVRRRRKCHRGESESYGREARRDHRLTHLPLLGFTARPSYSWIAVMQVRVRTACGSRQPEPERRVSTS
jgi:hypothetical protein